MNLTHRRSALLFFCFLLIFPILAAWGPARADITNVIWPDNYLFTNPVVIMSTSAASVDDLTSDTDVSFWVLNTSGEQGINLQDTSNPTALNPEAVEVSADVHIRGQSTAGAVKKQFSVKLTEDWPADKGNGNFLNMEHGGKHWIFNDAGVVDLSMIRNLMAFDMQRTLGENTGSKAWAPRTEYFELFIVTGQKAGVTPTVDQVLDGYAGVYINMEEIRAEKHHIDIPEDYAPVSADAVGGLILQINHQNDDSKVQLAGGDVAIARTGETMVVQWPDADKLTSDQIANINKWYYDASLSGQYKGWASLFNTYPDGYLNPPGTINPLAFPAGTDKATYTADYWNMVEQYTDLQSMAEYFLLNEIAKDPDGYHRSTFMYREPDVASDGTLTTGQMYAGPLWDKNKSYANPQLNYPVGNYDSTSGWLFTALKDGQAPWWWTMLSQYDGFQTLAENVWTQATLNETGAFMYTRIATLVDEQRDYLLTTGSYSRDYTLYYDGQDPSGPTGRLNKQVNDLLTYVNGRLDWLNDNLDKLGDALKPYM